MIRRHPNAVIVGVADGDPMNWEILAEIAETLGVNLKRAVDFYHALEHIAKALRRYRGGNKAKAREDIKHWASVLKHSPRGPQRVIEALEYRQRRVGKSAAEDIGREIAYVRRHMHLMPYSRFMDEGLPIGSGVQEAACKTLVGGSADDAVRNVVEAPRRPGDPDSARSRAVLATPPSLEAVRSRTSTGSLCNQER